MPRFGEQRHRAAQRVQRIADAVIAPAMAARTGERDLEAAAPQRAAGDVIGVGAVEHQEGLDLAGQRLLREVPHPQQIALAFFADVGHQQQVRRKIRGPGAILPGARHRQQGRQAGAIIGDARAEKTAIRFHRDIVLVARGDDRVQMRGQSDIRAASLGGDHVPGAVDGGIPSQGAEAFQEPGGALLFEERGRRHAAKLQVRLIDPLLLAREPLQALAHLALAGQPADVDARCPVGSHAD